MLGESRIREVFKMLGLETESERQMILWQGLPEPPNEPEAINRVIADNTADLRVVEESGDAELE